MKKKATIALVILSTFLTASNFNAGKVVVTSMSPLLAVTLRFALAALLMFLIALPQYKKFLSALKINLKIFTILGLLGVTGCNLLFFLGLKYTSAINASIIVAVTPMITMLLAAVILKEPIHGSQKIGLVLGLIGVLIVITHGSLDVITHMQLQIGDSIVLLADICWALYGILNGRYVKESTPFITTTATMIIGAFVLCLITLFVPHQALLITLQTQSVKIYSLLIYMAAFGSVLAYLFWNYGIEHLGANLTTLFFNLIPIFTGLIGFITGASISVIELTGGALVIMGVLIAMNLFSPGARKNLRPEPRDSELQDRNIQS